MHRPWRHAPGWCPIEPGPTYPVEGTFETASGPVRFIVVRSETIGTGLPVVLLDPVPSGISGVVEYRRLKSDDAWSSATLAPGTFEYERRGRAETISGTGTALPGLTERAGKSEIFLRIDDGSGRLVSVTGDRPIYARFKGDVPTVPLIAHILVIFTSMLLASRTVLEAIVDGRYGWMLGATIVSLLLGAFL